MNIKLLLRARNEIDETHTYYENQVPGLGDKFVRELYSTLKRIKNNPGAWSPFSENTRRCLMNTFPYGIIYQVKTTENEIIIIAIAHLNRKPEYWK